MDSVRNSGYGETILDIRSLKTYFFTEDGTVRAVDGVDLSVRRGETLGLVGESGCGKSVTMFSVMRLVGEPGKVVEGEVWFDGRNLTEVSDADMQDIRGNRMAMIFQQPLTSLNPVFRIGDQIAEVFEIHQGLSKEEPAKKPRSTAAPGRHPRRPSGGRMAFPHEISGGRPSA